MKAIFACLLAALALSAVEALSPFTIPLPSGPSAEQFFCALGGNMYYTVGTGGTVYGVNLTSKSVAFQSTYDGDILEGLFAVNSTTNPMVLVALEEQYLALGPTGDLLWVSSGFSIDVDRKHSYAIFGEQLFIASNENGAFYVVSLKTGEITNQYQISQGSIEGDLALLTVVNPNTDATELVAFELPAMTILWKVKNVDRFLTANKNYLIVTNDTSNGDTEVLVLDPTTEKTLFTWEAMNGISQYTYTPRIVDGDKFMAEVGEETARIVVYSLKTGEMITQVYIGEDGAGVNIVGNSIVSITQTTLSIQPLFGNSGTITRTHVPYTSAHTIVQNGESENEFNVVNLQGWTTWDSKGNYISRNEKAPNSGSGGGGSSSYVFKWDGYYVQTVGAAVTGTPIN